MEKNICTSHFHFRTLLALTVEVLPPGYEVLTRKGLPNWSWDKWTSSLRAWAGYPGFTRDSGFTDFTYTDQFGAMREVLRDWGVPIDPEWTNQTQYHFEVKTTPGRCEFTSVQIS